MTAKSCLAAWQHMTAISAKQSVRNFTQTLNMDDFLVETALFPRDVLEAYSDWNLEQPLNPNQLEFFNAQRGSGQGDYRAGMSKKIANVVNCLQEYPTSKRAIITICNKPNPTHSDDDNAKCLREIHFYIDQGKLHGTCFFRAQAALIFPKNIHFLGRLMQQIAHQLPQQPKIGQLFYLTSILVADRA